MDVAAGKMTKIEDSVRPKKPKKRFKAWFVISFLLLLLSPVIIVQLIDFTNRNRIYTEVADMPTQPIAIVFGAGLEYDGRPSIMLTARLESAIELYKANKVKQLLMTGDSVTSREVSSMRNYAMQQGIPAKAILSDSAGLRTYDSCYRAFHNFDVTNAILVTQEYHLPRALYLCNSLGVKSVGLKAGINDYPNQDWYNYREFLATFLSWVDITITKPLPEVIK